MVETYGLSDVGCIRELNEDCFCIHGFADGEERGFCILADGMGGHNAGEVASQNTVKAVADELKTVFSEGKDNEMPSPLNLAINMANERVYKMSVANDAHSGMGTTVVASFITNGMAYLANIGDSRAYVYGEDGLKQITVDHSVVEELVRSGIITKSEARRHPQKNLITRAVGTNMTVSADLFEYEYSVGDIMILCSDGLCSMVDDEEISEIVKNGETTEEIACRLVERAKLNGGFDNITVVCVRFI